MNSGLTVPSTYYEHKARQRAPDHLSDRAKRDAQLKTETGRVWQENFCVYGVQKIWRQMNREGFGVARCTVERLMRKLGIAGAVRGQKKRSTTVADDGLERPVDLVNRVFSATRPNQLVDSSTLPS